MMPQGIIRNSLGDASRHHTGKYHILHNLDEYGIVSDDCNSMSEGKT